MAMLTLSSPKITKSSQPPASHQSQYIEPQNEISKRKKRQTTPLAFVNRFGLTLSKEQWQYMKSCFKTMIYQKSLILYTHRTKGFEKMHRQLYKPNGYVSSVPLCGGCSPWPSTASPHLSHQTACWMSHPEPPEDRRTGTWWNTLDTFCWNKRRESQN